MKRPRVIPLPLAGLALSLMVAIVAGSGCGALGFDIEEKIPPQEVQGSPLGALLPVSLFEFPLRIDIESNTKAQGTGPARSAHLKSVKLKITAPEGGTFDFLDMLTIKISGPNLAEMVVARLADVPAQSEISLQVVPEVDLLPYINAGATMRAEATGRMPRQNVRFEGSVVVRVKV